jgi:hypothetical protein
MVVRLLIALVLQITLTLPAGVLAMSSSCKMATTCSCCEKLPSCPCLKDSERSEKPTPPQTPPEKVLKLNALAPGDTVSVIEINPVPGVPGSLPGRTPLVCSGYSGMGLTVSFCRWVI